MMHSVNDILFVIPGKDSDSEVSMSFAKRLAKSISAEGASVEILMVGKTFNPYFFAKQGFELRAKVKTLKPDVVVAQYGTFTGILVAAFSQRPKIITFRGTDLNPANTENKVKIFFQHLASHIASFLVDGVICVSEELRQRLFCKKTAVVIPSSTDTELFRPLDQAQCRYQLGWVMEKPIAIFFAGSNARIKRLDMAIEMQKLLCSRNNSVELKIIRELVPLHEMPVYLSAADCLVFLSDYEGSPNLVREACACNTPIVTVAVGDVFEVLRNVVPSEIVKRNISELAAAVCRLAELRTRSNGREHVQHYSNQIIARRTIDFYSRVVGQCGR